VTNCTDGVGYGFSDDEKGFTSDIWVYGGTVDAAERPFYIYECKRIHIDAQGKKWKGHNGMDMYKAEECTFDNLDVLIWSKRAVNSPETSWQWNTGTINCTARNCKVSSAGAIAAGFNPCFESIVLRSGATGNKLLNMTTIVGLKADGKPYAPLNNGGDGRIVNQGGDSNIIGNNTYSSQP
jgi:hypothetical protein